ncbi:ECF RNA polymerase sigma factor SigE [Aquisphaera giovannonii]|uniref:ECF RNA polymerase sigma factor SigE n=1 Tax=Aquisphaera giovannonii TaxID=406548 RepID=A0A5B9W1H2_9BACT|nr:sigma-70 family RNA polymerase sigma factor [Aquisphaera giovannonii]QEH34403.1 ECF RNA polymerase sigma factor SigE [Aquisphaera giovannonii]
MNKAGQGAGSPSLARELEAIFRGAATAGTSEGQLIDRFVDRGDEAAFAAILTRHGPMVLGVCRRILGPGGDAEDAFQATFLVLLRRARTLRRSEPLGPWLHGVAWRVATRSRADGRRRDQDAARAVRDAISHESPAIAAERLELKALVDEELGRLPEKYRLPIVLCDLEGMTKESAAARLRWRPGVLRGRLERARLKLRDRLARRGLAPAAAVAIVEAWNAAEAAVPGDLIAAARAAAFRDLAVSEIAGVVAPSAAARLAGGFLGAQARTRTLLATATAVALAVVTFSALGLASAPRSAGRRAEGPRPRAAAPAPPPDAPTGQPRDFELSVVGPGGKPIPDANVEIHAVPGLKAEDVRRGRFVKSGPRLSLARADGGGKLAVHFPAGCKELDLFIEAPGHGFYHAGWSPRGRWPSPVEWPTREQSVIPDRFTAELEPGWAVGGVVVDSQGRPVEGAEVRCKVWTARPGDWIAPYEGNQPATDREGRWRFDNVPNSVKALYVIVSHPAFRPFFGPIEEAQYGLARGGGPREKIVLQRGDFLFGKVTDERGRPIHGARVEVRLERDTRDATSDEHGMYRLNGLDGRIYYIRASAPGKGLDEKGPFERIEGPIAFTLKPGRKIRIRVLDAGGNPLPDTAIFPMVWRDKFSFPEINHGNRYTDKDGVWEWNEAPEDEFQFEICPPGGMVFPRQRIKAREEEYVFRSIPPLVIAGRIIDETTKQPIPSARINPGVEFAAEPGSVAWNDKLALPLQADGRFEYRPRRAEAGHGLRIEADGYEPQTTRWFKSTEGKVEIEVRMKKARAARPGP